MRDTLAPAIRREDYAPPAFWIRSVELNFDLDAARTIVSSRMRLERNTAVAPQPLRLHGEELNLLRVLVNGESVSFRHEDGELVIDSLQGVPEGGFTLEIRNTCAPDKNTQLSGLYTSGGGLFTQCEAQGFRRITYFLDRPDVMAVYKVTLRADRRTFPVLLANGNLVEQGDLPDGRHFAVWHDPFPKPSYLFAIVAADLVAREQRIRSRSGREHLLQVFVRRGDLDKTEHAMNSLIASIVWDEQRFGLPLDLERFMIVAVGDFNMGAMENKGLNIFNTKYVLANPATATDADFEAIESVVAHEYFHNWTGNRVTCRDWFQLSLKEGLTVFRDQEFSADMAGRPVAPGGDPYDAGATARAVRRIADVRNLRTVQFPEDAGPQAHPVRPDSYVEINNFYTATIYEKGAEVVRMMQTLVGRAGFAAGLALYFKRHDGQAVTVDDFARAIADANPDSALARSLPAFMRWYSQAGTPRVTARGAYDAERRRYTLTLSQAGTPSPGQPLKAPWVVPVTMGLVSHDGHALALRPEGVEPDEGDPATERTLVLESHESQFVFTDVPTAPVPSLLRGFSAPVQLDDGLGDAELLVLLAHDPDAFNRWEAGQRLMMRRLLEAVRQGRQAGTPVLDAALLDALRGVLRHPRLAPALKELALTPPGQTLVAEQCDVVDPQVVHAVHESALDQLATGLHDDWVWAWEQTQDPGTPAASADAAGRRALGNLAQAMIARRAVLVGDPVWPGRIYQRFKDAATMTERLGALAALLHAHSELAEPALERFHAMFRAEPLVIDKWFALQATAPERDGRVFERARRLLQHPDFSLKNPNRARSLIGSLCSGNPAAFHRRDAAGYVFWADRLLEIDPHNPQLAARLARALDRWSRLAAPYRDAAREAIARVAAAPRLSNDVQEILNRALEN
jgi:aminopeptidase N